MGTTTRVAPLLLRGRITAGRGLVDLLAVAAFTISSGLLLTVLAGLNAFVNRQASPPQPFLDAVGPGEAAFATQNLVSWTVLAASASVLLVVPVVTLGAAAARMGALGRDQRLSTLRLLGITSGQATALTAGETMLAALAGGVLGLLGYLVSLPLWAGVTFQATPLSAAQMLLPPQAIAAIIGALVLLSGASSVSGLIRLRLSPLGVARRQARPALRVWRFLALPLVVVGWIALAPTLDINQGVATVGTVIVVALAIFMGVINLIGPWMLQLVGRLMARSRRPSVLLAGRRLLAEPKAAWRSVSGLAFVGFTGGALLSLPNLASSGDALTSILVADLRTGTYLTLAIAFVVAATSTLLNQATAVLDRRTELKQLDNLGVPVTLHDRTRGAEVVVPAAMSALGASGLAVFFFAMLPKAGVDELGLLSLAASLVGGIFLVWAAGEACRPLVRSAVTGGGVRTD